jgi:hypothetical protein
VVLLLLAPILTFTCPPVGEPPVPIEPIFILVVLKSGVELPDTRLKVPIFIVVLALLETPVPVGPKVILVWPVVPPVPIFNVLVAVLTPVAMLTDCAAVDLPKINGLILVVPPIVIG